MAGQETQDMTAVIGAGPAEEEVEAPAGSAPGTPLVDTQTLGDVLVDDVSVCLDV
jgi:hypothetical protein